MRYGTIVTGVLKSSVAAQKGSDCGLIGDANEEVVVKIGANGDQAAYKHKQYEAPEWRPVVKSKINRPSNLL